MGTIEGIRKHGYRKWYERQLVESHVWLLTMVLALVMMFAGLDALSAREGPFDLLFDSTVVLAGAGLSWQSWRRYASTMLVAEHVGHQATCPACRRYGFVPVPPGESGVAERPLQLMASCRRCGHRWQIDAGL